MTHAKLEAKRFPDLIPGYLLSSLACHLAASPTVSTKTYMDGHESDNGAHDGLAIWSCTQHTALCSTSCRFTPICNTSSSSLNVDSFARLFKLILSLHTSRQYVRLLMHTTQLLLHSPAYLESILTEMSVALRASFKKQICESCCIASNKSSRLSSFNVLLSAYALEA